MLADEIMTRRPLTGTPHTSIRRALGVLRRGRFRHLPIVQDGQLYGVLSDRDLQRAVAAGLSEDEPVAGVLRAPAITATPDTPVEGLARLLQDNKIGCLPIVASSSAGQAGDDAGGVLVGIVTGSDVFAAFARALGITEPGSRVVVRLDEPAADLLRVARVLADLDAPLLSLFTEPLTPPSAHVSSAPGALPSRPRLRLTLRLGTINPRPIEAVLTAAGLDVERAPTDPVEAPAEAAADPCPRVAGAASPDPGAGEEAPPWRAPTTP